jgi:hypothetical protein
LINSSPTLFGVIPNPIDPLFILLCHQCQRKVLGIPCKRGESPTPNGSSRNTRAFKRIWYHTHRMKPSATACLRGPTGPWRCSPTPMPLQGSGGSSSTGTVTLSHTRSQLVVLVKNVGLGSWRGLGAHFICPRFVQVVLDTLEEHGVHGDDDGGDGHQECRPLGPEHDAVGRK